MTDDERTASTETTGLRERADDQADSAAAAREEITDLPPAAPEQDEVQGGKKWLPSNF